MPHNRDTHHNMDNHNRGNHNKGSHNKADDNDGSTCFECIYIERNTIIFTKIFTFSYIFKENVKKNA